MRANSSAARAFRVVGIEEVAVTLTVMVSIAIALYTQVHCLCGRRLYDAPGRIIPEVRRIESEAERSGRGRALTCKRCSQLVEVIEHG